MRERKRNGKKNGIPVLAVLLVFTMIWPSFGFGDESIERKTAFKVGAGSAFYTGQSFDPGLFYRGGFFTLLSPRLGLEVLVAHNSVHMNKPLTGLSAGKLATTQILISSQYRFPQKGQIAPFAIFGVEFNFFHVWPEDKAEEDKNGVVDRFAPHIGAGLDWLLSDWLALSVDARYNIVKTWVEELPREGRLGEIDPTKLDQVNLNTLTLTLGLKFYL